MQNKSFPKYNLAKADVLKSKVITPEDDKVLLHRPQLATMSHPKLKSETYDPA